MKKNEVKCKIDDDDWESIRRIEIEVNSISDKANEWKREREKARRFWIMLTGLFLILGGMAIMFAGVILGTSHTLNLLECVGATGIVAAGMLSIVYGVSYDATHD